jgi:hypothetical protein
MATVTKPSDVIHILDEAASSGSAMTSRMWCGAECIELFDRTFIPDMDFGSEAQAEFSTCAACRRAFESRVVSL